MKTLSAAIIGLMLATGAAAFQGADPLKAILASYLEIQSQLAADKIDGIGTAAATIESNAAGLGQEQGEQIAKAAKTLGQAADLKAARDAFGPLSDAVIAAAQADGKGVEGVKVGFCPMVKRSWLQKDAKVRNPYYGSAMLECGELKDLKK